MMKSGGTGFLSGAAAGFFGSLGASAWGKVVGDSTVGMIAFGALSAGVSAELTGGNFWDGAIIGGIVAGLNDAMHKVANKMQEKHDLDAFAKQKFGADYKVKLGVKSLKWGSQMKKEEVTGYSYSSKKMLIVGPTGDVGGITTTDGRIYISDIYKIYPSAYLEVTLGHELIHSYHHMKFGNNYNQSFSEFSAYQYSIEFSLYYNDDIDVKTLKGYRSNQLKFVEDKKCNYDHFKIPGFN